MILHDDTSDTILTNGCYKITIDDERERLSFYRFLLTPAYRIQIDAFATGSIMLDIKEDDLRNNLVFPMLPPDEFSQMKEFIKQQEFLVKLRTGF